MRVIRANHALPRLAPMDLSAVRGIGRRFPGAGLRDVAVVRAPELDGRADQAGGVRVWLALEALQTTGSFKVRGALVALDRVKRARGESAHVVASSAGNHGAGVAYAARVLGLRATLVVPSSVPRAKRARMERYGAAVIVAPSPSYDDAEARAIELAAETGATFVSPYDDPDVIAGNGGSLGLEIVLAMKGVPDLAIAPIGGGGLATGLAHAFAVESDESARTRTVWAAQSEASAAMALSLERGQAVERLPPAGATLAEGLEGGISRAAFERAREAISGVVVVGEAEIARAMGYAYREMGLVIEGSAAAALAPVLSGLPPEVRARRDGEALDLVVVLTGRNVDRERLASVGSGEYEATLP